MNLMKQVINEIHDLLSKNNINEVIDLRISNLDSYDYQINNLVKYQNHVGIDEIIKKVSESLNSSDLIDEFEFAKNLFINFRINAESIIDKLKDVEKNILTNNSQDVIIDYGGPNIGKPLHVGHLRPLNIGRSIYFTNKIIGNNIISDIHLGDWGMPVAQIITHCELENISFDDLSIEMLQEIYPKASSQYAADENFKKKAKETNKRLSSEEQAALSNWEKINNITLEALKETLAILHHDFDYW